LLVAGDLDVFLILQVEVELVDIEHQVMDPHHYEVQQQQLVDFVELVFQ
tara:strand:+ start:116 stop:262 length:147 start_codon:yes stop_codon:yes gene_type:complete